VSAPLLSVSGLRVRLATASGPVTVVAGESGSGKTVSVLALLGLLPDGAAVDGTAMFDGTDLLRLGPRAMRDVRGNEIAMVFQDPMTSLHPMMTIGLQLTEHIRFHLGASAAAARDRAVELLHEVRIPDAAGALNAYPHQFSGGMRQRIAIAIALACGPRILIADEPTTALDVTVQAGILRLLDRLRRQSQLSVILITHDLGVMSSIADELMVMYAGRVAESGPTASVLGTPRHPYTAGLLAALPHPEALEDTPLVSIRGAPPSPQARPDGCPFHPRCAYAVPSCATDVPALAAVGGTGRRLACPPDPFASPSAGAEA
jgi:oligopeptide/dipeptide ABC transporter ATP-binding protein